VPGPLRMTPASAPQPEPQDRIGGSGNDPEVASLAAGTQALPVDTKTDRHPPGYMASYMRQWRAKQKAAKMALTPNVNTMTGR
jgi:hypothetical protein